MRDDVVIPAVFLQKKVPARQTTYERRLSCAPCKLRPIALALDAASFILSHALVVLYMFHSGRGA